MLNDYLNFGMCNCSGNFMVISRCYACAAVIFVDLSEHFCWYLVNMSFYGINLINVISLCVSGQHVMFLVILWCVCVYNPCG